MITSDKCNENVEWALGYRENDASGGKDRYSASKAGAEMAIRAWHQSYFKSGESQVKLVAARAGNVIGGGDWAAARIVPDCMRAWSQGPRRNSSWLSRSATSSSPTQVSWLTKTTLRLLRRA